MSTLAEPDRAARPVERYLGGIHHMAQPTVDPRATLAFYVGVMGAKITHCVSSRGWRPNHYDYIHMFLDLGKGDNIAMFYYFGVEDPKDWPRMGTHHSFSAQSLTELEQWASWLESNGFRIQQHNTYEVFTSIYVWDPNGRFLEIAANHRPLNEIDALNAELTADALKLAADEKAPRITRMWEIKAGLVEQQCGVEFDGPTIIFPNNPEFDWIIPSAGESAGATTDLESFTALHSADGDLRLRKPTELPESIWWSVGTGGVKGAITRHDEQEFVVA
jgi:catechol 2,3-dioxygenase-like lactoylglutathione lyase family enzyme